MIFACYSGSTIELHNNSDVLDYLISSTLVLLPGINQNCQVQFLLLSDILLNHTASFWWPSAGVLQYSCCFVIRVLVDRDIWIDCRDIRVLHSPGVCHVALHYNASEWFASSNEFAAAVWPTVSGCFAPRLVT